jgi:hypothetical protein
MLDIVEWYMVISARDAQVQAARVSDRGMMTVTWPSLPPHGGINRGVQEVMRCHCADAELHSQFAFEREN